MILHLAKSGGANAFCRAVVIGGAGGALATPEFGSSVNPIPTRGYAHPESTKQMEQTLRAKVKIFFKSENFKKCF